MTLFDTVKMLSDKQRLSINEVEEAVGFSRNTLYKWKKSMPNTEKLEAIADFFNVTTDYLLGREVKGESSEESERNIQRDLDRLIEGLNGMAYSKDVEEMSNETKELLIASLEQAARIARLNASKEN